MKSETFVRRSRFEAPAEAVFRWHARPGAFERYNPPWEPVELVEDPGGIAPGSRAVIRMKLGPFPMSWVAEHTDYEEGRQFRDVQRSGPFAKWEHLHRIVPDGPDACVLEDRIEYALPMGALGRALGGGAVRAKLDRMFAYRHETLRQDLKAREVCSRSPVGRVLVSGSTGLIGSALIPLLTTAGHEVTRLVRRPPREGERAVAWDPGAGTVDLGGLEGHDAVVHLAGEPIASGRWTVARKGRIRASRVEGTRRLAEALARLDPPPRVLLSASAIGFYGDRGDEVLDESSPPGSGFLADVCREWEEATGPASDRGIRVVHLRIGVVLDPRGGALGKMLGPFRMGLGGPIGSGRQYLSWIALDDAIGAIHHAMHVDELAGPVNLVAPGPVTSREFARTLGRVLHWPSALPVPAAALRLAFGELADEALLAGARVLPARLQGAGYAFRYPSLEGALRHMLGRTGDRARPLPLGPGDRS